MFGFDFWLSIRLAMLSCQFKVHALNILRALFRDTKLGQEVLPFIADGVKAAILGFAAKLWAVSHWSFSHNMTSFRNYIKV